MTWHPDEHEGRPGDLGPRKVAESLDAIAAGLGVPGASALRAVFAGWEGLVGELVAAHAQPAMLRGAVLVVDVDEPAWAVQLRWLEADLLTRLRSSAGAPGVERLHVRVRPPPPERRG